MRLISYTLAGAFVVTATWGLLARDWWMLGAATVLQILMLLAAIKSDRKAVRSNGA